MVKKYNLKLTNELRDKTGKVRSQQITWQRADKGNMNFDEVRRIYQGLLDKGIPYDKIYIVASNPYMKFFSIKGRRDYEISDIDDEEYWMNRSQETRDKLEELEFVNFIVYK